MHYFNKALIVSIRFCFLKSLCSLARLSKHSSLYAQYCLEIIVKNKSITVLHVFVYVTAEEYEFILPPLERIYVSASDEGLVGGLVRGLVGGHGP